MGTATQRKATTPKAPQAKDKATDTKPAAVTVPQESADEATVPTPEKTADGALIFPLWDGRQVKMKKPEGVYTLLMYRLLGDQSTNEVLNLIYHGIFHLRELDGESIAPPRTQSELDFIAGQLGDDGLDQIGSLYLAHFSPRVANIRPL